MRSNPDYAPSLVTICRTCGKIHPHGTKVCAEQGCRKSNIVTLYRLGCDLVDDDDPRLEPHRKAGTLPR